MSTQDERERLRAAPRRRGRADPDAAEQRFRDWYAERVAGMLTDPDPPGTTRRLSLRADGGVDIVAESATGRTVIGSLDALGIARGRGTAMERYVLELAAANAPLPGGRPSEQDARIRAIVAVAAELGAGKGATVRSIAARMGKAGPWGGEPTGQIKQDISAAGGIAAIRRRAQGGEF